MNDYDETFGVDISKAVFDIQGSTIGHNQLKMMCLVLRNFLKDYLLIVY
jgi:hypothetical protein